MFVTHAMEDAKHISDRIIMLSSGRIINAGKTHELL